METKNEKQQCKCSGSKKIDPNAIRLDETTVDFIQVQKDDFTHYCFDGRSLSKNKILHNIIVGKNILQDQDQLVVSSKESLLDDLNINSPFCAKECCFNDEFFTVVTIES